MATPPKYKQEVLKDGNILFTENKIFLSVEEIAAMGKKNLTDNEWREKMFGDIGAWAFAKPKFPQERPFRSSDDYNAALGERNRMIENGDM